MYLCAIYHPVIKKFGHRGSERFFAAGSKSGIQTRPAECLRWQLGRLDAAMSPEDMNLVGWKLHALKDDLRGYWAVWVDQKADATHVD